jgi:hypothetical protein
MKQPFYRTPAFMIATGVFALAAWIFIFFYYPSGWISRIAMVGAIAALLMIRVLRRSHREQHEMVTVVLGLSLLSLGLIIAMMVIALL